MEITVNVEWHLTEDARERAKDCPWDKVPKSWPRVVYPQTGDWISFPGFERFAFRVLLREMRPESEDHLWMKLVLELPVVGEEEPPLKLVRLDGKPVND